jgi:hypothetical protein
MGWIGMIPLAFLICALAWVLAQLHGMLRKVEQKFSGAPVPAIVRADVLGWLCDLVLVLLVVWATPRDPADLLVGQAFAPIMLILLLRIVPHALSNDWVGWIKDRTILALGFAGVAGLGIIPTFTQLLAVCLAGAAISLLNVR